MTSDSETIVQECLAVIAMGIIRNGYDTPEYKRSIKHIRDIEEHFGVKYNQKAPSQHKFD